MKYKVRIMPEAYDALAKNVEWWADNCSATQALEWYQAFIDAIHGLNEMPQSHPIARENAKTSYELRELLFSLGSRPTHRALFRVVADTVQILTVRHVAQDSWPE